MNTTRIGSLPIMLTTLIYLGVCLILIVSRDMPTAFAVGGVLLLGSIDLLMTLMCWNLSARS